MNIGPTLGKKSSFSPIWGRVQLPSRQFGVGSNEFQGEQYLPSAAIPIQTSNISNITASVRIDLFLLFAESHIRQPLQGGGRQRSRDIANLGGSLFRRFWSLWGSQSHFLPYLNAFLGILALGFPVSKVLADSQPWGLTVSLSSLS